MPETRQHIIFFEEFPFDFEETGPFHLHNGWVLSQQAQDFLEILKPERQVLVPTFGMPGQGVNHTCFILEEPQKSLKEACDDALIFIGSLQLLYPSSIRVSSATTVSGQNKKMEVTGEILRYYSCTPWDPSVFSRNPIPYSILELKEASRFSLKIAECLKNKYDKNWEVTARALEKMMRVACGMSTSMEMIHHSLISALNTLSGSSNATQIAGFISHLLKDVFIEKDLMEFIKKEYKTRSTASHGTLDFINASSSNEDAYKRLFHLWIICQAAIFAAIRISEEQLGHLLGKKTHIEIMKYKIDLKYIKKVIASGRFDLDLVKINGD